MKGWQANVGPAGLGGRFMMGVCSYLWLWLLCWVQGMVMIEE